MDRMILPLLGAIFLLLLGVGSSAFYYTHDPIGFHVHVWGPINPGFDLPDSLATKLAKADARADKAERLLTPWKERTDAANKDLAMCEDGQRAVLEASARALRDSQANASAAAAALQRATSHRKMILELPTADGDVCSRAKAVDAAFLATLNDEKE